ncbi:MAG: DUF4097 family beta strand repeat-containing protein [Thermoanaerobaculaceae bacterium]
MKNVRLLLGVLFLPAFLHGAERSEVVSKRAAAREGKILVVEAGPLDVSVRTSPIEEIRMDVELACAGFKEKTVEAWLEATRPSFEDSDEALKILVKGDAPGLFQGLVITKAKMSLVVPPYIRLDLSSSSGNLRVEGDFHASRPLRLFSGSGEVEFLGFAPEVEARTTSGDITLRFSQPVDSLLVRTASGDAEVVGGVRLLRCDTSSGELRAVGLLGSVGVATTSGDVSLKFDALPNDAQVKVNTTSGKVVVSLPPGTEPGGEVQSARGEIRSVHAGQTPGKGGRLVLTGPGPRLAITTSSGRVELY